jgi:hypothetical protein
MFGDKGHQAVIAFKQIGSNIIPVIITVKILPSQNGVRPVMRQHIQNGFVPAEKKNGRQGVALFSGLQILFKKVRNSFCGLLTEVTKLLKTDATALSSIPAMLPLSSTPRNRCPPLRFIKAHTDSNTFLLRCVRDFLNSTEMLSPCAIIFAKCALSMFFLYSAPINDIDS